MDMKEFFSFKFNCLFLLNIIGSISSIVGMSLLYTSLGVLDSIYYFSLIISIITCLLSVLYFSYQLMHLFKLVANSELTLKSVFLRMGVYIMVFLWLIFVYIVIVCTPFYTNKCFFVNNSMCNLSIICFTFGILEIIIWSILLDYLK
jgi:hypothetical protein